MYLHKHRERCESIHTIAVTLDLVAQTVESVPAMQETQVPSLGQKDPLEKEMAIHSSILAWKNPTDGGAWWAAVHGVSKSQTRLSTKQQQK